MRCERLIKYAAFLVMLTACSRESPAPATETATAATAAETAAPAPAPTALKAKTYDDAVTWFRSTPGFHFVVQENGIRAEGDMERATVGAETVRVAVGGEEWTAESGGRGVVWKRGGTETPAPEWGNRLFQRVTVAFDPQKSEGRAQVIDPSHYRFTDANSGALHDVFVDGEGRITKMTIGNTMSMTLSRQK
jgi:hypothetical protein